VLAIDPGTRETACVVWDGESVVHKEKVPNEDVFATIAVFGPECDAVVIEMIASYGMPVGAEVFEACVWIGRFVQFAHERKVRRVERVYRKEVAVHLCGSARAKDSNIRQALIDKHGPVGKKANPGRLWGVHRDMWAAHAVADFWLDNRFPSVPEAAT